MDPNQWYYVNFVTQLLDMNGSQTGCREISEGAVGVKPSGGGIGVVEGGDAVMLSRSVFFSPRTPVIYFMICILFIA